MTWMSAQGFARILTPLHDTCSSEISRRMRITERQHGDFGAFCAWIAVLIPTAGLLFQWVQLAKYPIDLPIYDDWGMYIFHNENAAMLDPRILFMPLNDTLLPVVRFLDAINVWALAGDNVLYQLITFTFLMGSLLVFNVLLIRKFSGDWITFSIPTVGLVLMMQPGIFWGMQSMAYHQAIPQLALTAAIYVLSCSQLSRLMAVCLIALLGIFSGFSYIFGALLNAAVALIGLLYYRLEPSFKEHWIRVVLGFGIATAITLPPQLNLLMVSHQFQISTGRPWSLPTETGFWSYFLGVFSRALGFFNTDSLVAVTAGAAYVLLSVVCLALLRPVGKVNPEFSFAYTSFCISSWLYIGMATAARKNMAGPEFQSLSDLFIFGQHPYYFFYAATLFPWAMLAILQILEIRRPLTPSLLSFFLAIVAGVLISSVSATPWQSYYKDSAATKLAAWNCIRTKLEEGQRVICANVALPWEFDLTAALQHAKELNVRFSRYLP
jgi:hypothetical protein